MKQVNMHFVTALLDPLVGGADDDEEVARYRHIGPEDENGMREVIRDRLKPQFERFDARSRDTAVQSLRYFLSKPDADFGRLYDSSLLPIVTPADPRRFFMWLWEELLEGEPFVVADLHQFQENNDIHAPNAIRLEPPKAGRS